jgi:Ulp1 family protease
MLTLIPIYQDFHFTLIVIDHIKRQIKGYDSLYGNPDGDNKMITNIRTVRRLLADEALAVNNHNYADDWVIVPDAARREGLPRQINGIDCGRYVILMALCLTHTPQIPLAAVTPLAIANS